MSIRIAGLALAVALFAPTLVGAPAPAAQETPCPALPVEVCQVGCEGFLPYRADGFRSLHDAVVFIDSLDEPQRSFASIVRMPDYVRQAVVVWRPRAGQHVPSPDSTCGGRLVVTSLTSVEQGMVFMMEMGRSERSTAIVIPAIPIPGDTSTAALMICVDK